MTQNLMVLDKAADFLEQDSQMPLGHPDPCPDLTRNNRVIRFIELALRSPIPKTPVAWPHSDRAELYDEVMRVRLVAVA
ncbi:MAG: hypothetical protein AAGF33_05405 [Pseudomonadota bacterium]